MQVNYITNGARNIKPLASVYGSMATRLIAQKLGKIKAFEALEDVVRLTNHQTAHHPPPLFFPGGQTRSIEFS